LFYELFQGECRMVAGQSHDFNVHSIMCCVKVNVRFELRSQRYKVSKNFVRLKGRK
jgi:hypothetical protein